MEETLFIGLEYDEKSSEQCFGKKGGQWNFPLSALRSQLSTLHCILSLAEQNRSLFIACRFFCFGKGIFGRRLIIH
jgi:hypothetical protein